jgi:benzodiazapine receptor
MTSDPITHRKPWRALLGFLVLCFAIAGVSGLVTATSVHDWYPTLRKPSFNPPDQVFGPVWSILYAMIAVSGWMVWGHGPVARQRAMPVYVVQLCLNFAWSLLFFGAHLIGVALIDILALLAAIVATGVSFARVDRGAAWLLLPYAAWVAFASVLNAAIWRLN